MSYDFKARFNEEDFMGFVKNKMFPGSDFYWKRANYNTKDFALNRIKSITLLGRSEDFDLAIYDMTHESENDPKVSLTREAFKFMRQNVEASTLNALIIFKSNNSDNYRLSLLTTDPNNVGRKTEREISNPRRFSFYLGPDAKTKTPEQFLIKKGAISNLEDLKSRFSVEVVNKEFYSKIAELFYRFIDEAKYPNSDRKKFFAVKLIGRIIFCWFLKKKKSDAGKPLMPEELLSLESLGKHQNYFHSVLEPLFFEVLNTPVEKRASAALLQIEDFAKSIPFLNGGLFEPDNDDKYQGTASYGVIEITDSWFNDLFELLETYNFTINENTPVDVELSIDPEMLGRIFENLLAEINPETGESARKATGSFYTPREIVEYMVNESLKAYLLQKVEIDEETVDKLLNWSEEAPELSESQSNGILEALDKMKVLDPACGSGAFPMGILQKTALVLEKIDPQSINWILKIVEKIPDSNVRKFVEDQLQKEDWSYVHKLGIIRNSIYGVDIQPIAVEISKLRFFLSLIIDTKINDNEENRGVKPLPNLETKFVCANSLIGLRKSDLEEDAKSMFPAIGETEKELFRTRNLYFTAHTKEEKNKIQSNDERLRTKLLGILVENGFKEDVTKNALMLAAWNPYKHNEVAPFFDPEWMFGVKDGFDIVIGNPPYGAKTGEAEKTFYRNNYEAARTANGLKGSTDTFTIFVNLGYNILCKNGILYFIIPMAVTSSDAMTSLHNLLERNCEIIKVSSYSNRPKQIFDAACIRTSIFAFCKTLTPNKHIYTTKLQRRNYKDSIEKIIKSLEFVDSKELKLPGRYAKISKTIEKNILQKIFATGKNIGSYSDEKGLPFYYRTSGGRYFNVISDVPTGSTQDKPYYVRKDLNSIIGAFLSSSLFWFYGQVFTDGLHIKATELEIFPLPDFDNIETGKLKTIKDKYAEYLADIEKNVVNHSTFKEYKLRKSKKLIDELDDLICPLYELSKGEIEFIKNYEIEFRVEDDE
jgi:23S rRNA G2445 N2-methylase RlmL